MESHYEKTALSLCKQLLKGVFVVQKLVSVSVLLVSETEKGSEKGN